MTTTNKTRPKGLSQLVDSTPLLHDPEALRARAAEDGHLFFKRLLPAEEVLEVRADMLAVVEKHGWRPPGIGALDGTVNVAALDLIPDEEMRLDIGVSIEAYHDTQKVESVHRLPHHPNILAMFRTLFGREALVHPRHILRMVTAHHSMVPTPQHQDFPLIQGTPNTWTCWIPIGDCPRTMGGLTVLRGSHKEGYMPVRSTRGAGGIAAQFCDSEPDWVTTDYEIGDLLTFPSYTVHRALPARQKDQIRLSYDARYQPVDEPIEEKSLLPHCALTWEEIYADWQRDDLKYYWRKQDLQFVPWNDSYMQPKRRIC